MGARVSSEHLHVKLQEYIYIYIYIYIDADADVDVDAPMVHRHRYNNVYIYACECMNTEHLRCIFAQVFTRLTTCSIHLSKQLHATAYARSRIIYVTYEEPDYKL